MSPTLVPSPPVALAWQTVWPEVARRLHGYLHGLHCPEADRDDVVGEVALRLVRTQVTCSSADDLLHWACPVARNVYFTLLRDRRRHPSEGLEALADRPSAAADPHDQVTAALAMEAIADLVPVQQRYLLEACPARPRNAAERQARRRLLVGLRALLGAALAAAVLLGAAAARAALPPCRSVAHHQLPVRPPAAHPSRRSGDVLRPAA